MADVCFFISLAVLTTMAITAFVGTLAHEDELKGLKGEIAVLKERVTELELELNGSSSLD